MENDILKSEFNLDQIFIEKNEKLLFETVKDWKVERKFSEFWFKKVRDSSKILEKSVIGGIFRVVFLKQDQAFDTFSTSYLSRNKLEMPEMFNGKTREDMFEKLLICYLVVNFEELIFYRCLGTVTSIICRVNWSAVIEIFYNCTDLIIKLGIIDTQNIQNSMTVFLICHNAKEFRKWFKVLPSLVKRFKIAEEIVGDTNEIGFTRQNYKKMLPIDLSELEAVKDNADFILSDKEDGAINLYRRINDRYKKLYDNFVGNRRRESSK